VGYVKTQLTVYPIYYVDDMFWPVGYHQVTRFHNEQDYTVYEHRLWYIF